MMITSPLAQVGGSPFKPSTTLSGSEGILLWMIVIIAAIILVWAVWLFWSRRSESTRQWKELAALSRRAEFSREEYAFVRRVFRRRRIKEPMSIMRSEHAYMSFFAKQTEWAGYHTEILVQSIKRKVFGTSRDADRSK